MDFWKTLIPDEPFISDGRQDRSRPSNKIPRAVKNWCLVSLVAIGLVVAVASRDDLCALNIVHAVFLERPRFERKLFETEDFRTDAGCLSDKSKCAMVRDIDLCGCACDGVRYLPCAVVHLHQSLGFVDQFARMAILESRLPVWVNRVDFDMSAACPVSG